MRSINYIVLLVSGVLAFFSFAISYSALVALASGEGINPPSLFPLIIDGVIILSLIWRLSGDEKDLSRIVMSCYVLLSIALNAVSHGSVLGAIMAAVAPISLFICSEISASMLHPKKRTQAANKNPDTCIGRDSRGRFVKKDV